MTSITTDFDYKTTINIAFDFDNFNKNDILKLVKEKLEIAEETLKKNADLDEAIFCAQIIEQFDCDCYACATQRHNCSELDKLDSETT